MLGTNNHLFVVTNFNLGTQKLCFLFTFSHLYCYNLQPWNTEMCLLFTFTILTNRSVYIWVIYLSVNDMVLSTLIRYTIPLFLNTCKMFITKKHSMMHTYYFLITFLINLFWLTFFIFFNWNSLPPFFQHSALLPIRSVR